MFVKKEDTTLQETVSIMAHLDKSKFLSFPPSFQKIADRMKTGQNPALFFLNSLARLTVLLHLSFALSFKNEPELEIFNPLKNWNKLYKFYLTATISVSFLKSVLILPQLIRFVNGITSCSVPY